MLCRLLSIVTNLNSSPTNPALFPIPIDRQKQTSNGCGASSDGISLLCVCKDEDEKLYFCNCTEVRSEERWVLYPASKQQIEQIVSKSKTPAEVFRDSRVVYMYTIGLDTDQGTLRELAVNELPDADRLPEGAYL